MGNLRCADCLHIIVQSEQTLFIFNTKLHLQHASAKIEPCDVVGRDSSNLDNGRIGAVKSGCAGGGTNSRILQSSPLDVSLPCRYARIRNAVYLPLLAKTLVTVSQPRLGQRHATFRNRAREKRLRLNLGVLLSSTFSQGLYMGLIAFLNLFYGTWSF